MKLNAAWHLQHPMPKNPTTEQRIAWHMEHQKHCSCRPIPAKLLALMNAASTAASKAEGATVRATKRRK